VDLREDCNADLIADVRELPYEDGTVEHILAFDLLEHFSKFETQILLREWHRVLQPGGLLTLRMPNMHVLAVQLSYWHARPGRQLDDIINNIYGGHRWGPDGAWDTHHTGFSPSSIRCVLDEAGFDTLSNDEATNMTVKARKRA
jgi:ubiquinone/menaquinone biosynthesis C-methylase UbiE